MRFVGLPSHDGWIRKWFFKTELATVEHEQVPRLRVLRDVQFEIDVGGVAYDETSLMVVAMLELDGDDKTPSSATYHQPLPMRRA